MRRPRIAVTTGEPAGIGPELCASLSEAGIDADLTLIGDEGLLKQRARSLGYDLQGLNIEPIALIEPAHAGELNPANATYVLNTLDAALNGCKTGQYDAMVTAPVQKSVINEAGISFSGHTEYLAENTAASQVVMLLATEHMRVALATTHLPLSQVPAAINGAKLDSILRLLQWELTSKFAISTPCIGVLGLNPHAGEGGHMGREEIDVIIPCLESLKAEGMNLIGPLPADTAFNKDILSRCDAILAMYHDQGLPVLKYSGFGQAVNITLGLPIIRTSVDHGTALDLAGTGKADNGSLIYAIKIAADMVRAGTH